MLNGSLCAHDRCRHRVAGAVLPAPCAAGTAPSAPHCQGSAVNAVLSTPCGEDGRQTGEDQAGLRQANKARSHAGAARGGGSGETVDEGRPAKAADFAPGTIYLSKILVNAYLKPIS